MRQPVSRGLSIGMTVVSLVALGQSGLATAQTVEWPAYAADQAGTKYLPLDQITKENVVDLEIVWRQPVIPDAIRNGETTRGPVGSQTTPLMVGGLLFFSTGLGTIAALEPTTGEVVWNTGPQRRGAGPSDAWHCLLDRRRHAAHRGGPWDQSWCRSTRAPASGTPTSARSGEVDLRVGLLRPFPTFFWNSAPIIVRDVVIIGSFIPDILSNQVPATKEALRGDVRGFDVRTGEHLWTFHTIPLENEFGVETWGADPVDDRASWEYSGNTNMWAHPTGDEELGIVYLPLSTPSNDYYGGHRPGDNLFAESLVAVDATTGERLWHFQAVHHGVWDYDFASSAVLLDIHRRWTRDQGSRPAKQAGVHLCVRPGHGRTGVADRGAAGTVV